MATPHRFGQLTAGLLAVVLFAAGCSSDSSKTTTGSTSTVAVAATTSMPDIASIAPTEASTAAPTSSATDSSSSAPTTSAVTTSQAASTTRAAPVDCEPPLEPTESQYDDEPIFEGDIDGDGTVERVYTGWGNTAHFAHITTTNPCGETTVVRDTADDLEFGLLYGASSNACAPNGCFVRVDCAADVVDGVDSGKRLLRVSQLFPSDPRSWLDHFDDPDFDTESWLTTLTVSTYRLSSGRMALVEAVQAEPIPFGELADAPSDADYGVIGC